MGCHEKPIYRGGLPKKGGLDRYGVGHGILIFQEECQD